MTRKLTRTAMAIIAIVCVVAVTDSCDGTTLEVQGDLRWTGAPTSDGDATWPATLEVMFPQDFQHANVRLSGMPYSGAWMTQDFVMTSADARIFGDDDGQVTLELEMSPLSDLTADTLADIVNVELKWAHPLFNDPVAPTSFLTIDGPPNIIVPEPSGLAIVLVLLGLTTAIIFPRP